MINSRYIITLFIFFNLAIFLPSNHNLLDAVPEKKSEYDGKKAIIFCFHDINGEGKYSITEDEFDEILKALDKKFEVYSLKDWYSKVKNFQKFKKPPIILTFDDGYPSIFSIVIPKLKKYSFGATFFIYLDKYDDKSEAYQIMSRLPNQFEIGSHSLSHADMETLYRKSTELFYKEIFLSKKKLEYLTGKPVVSWAWPYGYYNREMVEMAEMAGYELQVNTDYKTTYKQWNELSFSRYTVQNPDPVKQVEEILLKNPVH